MRPFLIVNTRAPLLSALANITAFLMSMMGIRPNHYERRNQMWYTFALFVHILGSIGLFIVVSLVVVAFVRMRQAACPSLETYEQKCQIKTRTSDTIPA